MSKHIVQRPQRWDVPFDRDMSDARIDAILSSSHFRNIQTESFPAALALRDIIRNDSRIREFQQDQLIVHAGAYINSAFILLSGSATLILAPGFDPSAWGQGQVKQTSTFSALRQWFLRHRMPEVRAHVGVSKDDLARSRGELPIHMVSDAASRAQAAGAEAIELRRGDLFGESAVLGRTEMNNTVVSQERTTVLEIRWQGLRDICKYDREFKQSVEQLYRERGLYEQLLNVPLFKHIPKNKLRELAVAALFEVHGEFEWDKDFRKLSAQARNNDDYNCLIEAEPLIAKEGDYPDGLLLLRNGFARLSRIIKNEHYTLGHLVAGELFGLQELYSSWENDKAQELQYSLRALGYTDVIRIPSHWLEQNVFQSEDQEVQSALAKNLNALARGKTHSDKHAMRIERKFTEFLVENRIVNGTQTMLIDLERCIRCDDCVTACSNANDNNPRFNRHGPTFGKYMVANACMHCNDPVCMIGCPTGAIHRSKNGVVSINDKTCIGCSSCANSCPYDNIRMVPIRDEKGQFFTDEKAMPIMKATKCDLCTRTATGPACENACSHDALVRIDVKDISRLADWVDR